MSLLDELLQRKKKQNPYINMGQIAFPEHIANWLIKIAKENQLNRSFVIRSIIESVYEERKAKEARK